MRIFALSDVHIDFAVNAEWIAALSAWDYRDDILILAGDITDRLSLLGWCLSVLSRRFRNVLFVPGNHELWVLREKTAHTSLEKFAQVTRVAESSGASMQPLHSPALSIVPLPAWYDYSFGEPSDELKSVWMDYHACKWPAGLDAPQITAHFLALSEADCVPHAHDVITFSHFLPRIDLLRPRSTGRRGFLDPVLGSTLIEQHLRKCGSKLHVYGHSHINRTITLDGVSYVNNAFGYPDETNIAAKRLLCIREG
jgi:predicted phosphodiesterase